MSIFNVHIYNGVNFFLTCFDVPKFESIVSSLVNDIFLSQSLILESFLGSFQAFWNLVCNFLGRYRIFPPMATVNFSNLDELYYFVPLHL